MKTLLQGGPVGTVVAAEAVAALAARAPAAPEDGRVIWSRRHGIALAALARVLVERGLPPLGSVHYADWGALSSMELSAGTRHAGQVDAVAAWAAAFGAELQVLSMDPQHTVVQVATVVDLGGDVRLRVWTAVRPPTHDPLVDQVLESAIAPAVTR